MEHGLFIYAYGICISLAHATGHSQPTYFQDDLTKYNFNSQFTSHPMLYFSHNDIQELHRKSATTHFLLFQELKKAIGDIQRTPYFMPPQDYETFGSHWNEMYGNNLPPLALYYILTKDEELLAFIKQYMDRMAAYKQWQVIASPDDEVPVAHSLAGFATAYDMMYPYLDKVRRKKYANKITVVVYEMFNASFIRWWGVAYIQNHQATNVVSILIGTLVLENHMKMIGKHKMLLNWQKRAVLLYERTLTLLEKIGDGSLNEGVGYGSYTTRSLTQYVFLAKRHFKVDHTDHPWLRKHFDFLYNTIIPGFGRTVGIADSRPNQPWFYGPESQLHFLDAFILKDGRANWLALKIKKTRESNRKDIRPNSSKYATLHTEFLFYDAAIAPHPPSNFDHPEFHKFTDWNVITYRSGDICNKSESFISFKSSKIHGTAINKIANSVETSDLNGWMAFNPGHEHPDQNSFTFWVSGQPFIADGHYGFKYPDLENTIMFRETPTRIRRVHSTCTHPWTGQLGACIKWLQFRGLTERVSQGDVLHSDYKDGIVFISGDSARAYPTSLGLANVYRSLVLLDKNTLLIFDHVSFYQYSKVSEVSILFNNFLHHFRNSTHPTLGLSGIYLESNIGFQGFWLSEDGNSPKATITSFPQVNVSNVNITFPRKGSYCTIVTVFHGPAVSLKQFSSVSRSSTGIEVNLETSASTHNVYVTANYEYTKKTKKICSVTNVKTGETTEFIGMKPKTTVTKLVSGNTDSTNREQTRTAQVKNHVGIHHYLLIIFTVFGTFFSFCVICNNLQRQKWRRMKRSYLVKHFVSLIGFSTALIILLTMA